MLLSERASFMRCAFAVHMLFFCQGLAFHARSEVRASATSPQQLFSFTHPAMGTIYSLFIYADDREKASAEADRSFAEIDDVEALLSNYQPQSELSRINALGSQQEVTTDPETMEFLQRSTEWSARSDGAFDITVGALMKAWGFFRSTGHIPSEEELESVRAKTGWKKIRLHAQTRDISFSAAGIELDPGGIGKGFAVDRVVTILRADGVKAALMSSGSSTIYALGAPPGKQGWRIEVPDPVHTGASMAEVFLRDTSLSTASCAEKHFVLAGHLYCHIMDPRQLSPVEGRLQATVIAPSATDSDALSNVLFVDGDAKRAAFMKSIAPEVRAIVVDGMTVSETRTAASAPLSGRTALHNRMIRCISYRWQGSMREPCMRAESKGIGTLDSSKCTISAVRKRRADESKRTAGRCVRRDRFDWACKRDQDHCSFSSFTR